MKNIIYCIAFFYFIISVSCFSQTVIGTTKQPASNSGFVFISPDFSSDKIDTIAGTKLTFTLVAKDSLGNIIQDWNSSGSTITVLIKNSSANTDSSNRSWNRDAIGYTFASLSVSDSLASQPKKTSDSTWEIPATLFSQGLAQISLIDTKAEQGVCLQIVPQRDSVKQTSTKMNFKPDTISNFLVEITSQTKLSDQVYQWRKFELIATPRDKYLNFSTDSIVARLGALLPDEFDHPSFDPISGNQTIKSPTAFYLVPTVVRKKNSNYSPQRIYLIATSDLNKRGRSNEFDVLKHEPGPFNLVSPGSDTTIRFQSPMSSTYTFTWSPQPSDVYKNIRVSRFSPTLISDVIHYKLVFSNPYWPAVLWYKISSNNKGENLDCTFSEDRLFGIVNSISSDPTKNEIKLQWWVEATDSAYITRSAPLGGYNITFIKDFPTQYISEPVALFSLSQNYPNPFGSRIGNEYSSTRISFSLDRSSQIMLKVYDALGKELSTLANQFYEAGEHALTFDATNLPAGNYFYRLFANGKVLARQMTVIK